MTLTGRSRGVLYIVWGDRHEHMLERSIASLRHYHPDIPVHVHRIEPTNEDVTATVMLRHKTQMARISPFENTLFLDSDTVVLGPLDFGFEKSRQFGLACCICECPWARRYKGLKPERDLVEYNTGVIFFTAKSEPVMYMWERLARTVDSSVDFFTAEGQVATMQYNDQASFAKAVNMTGYNPFVLPLNWNFRPKWHQSFFGPVRIWHSFEAVPADVIEITSYHEQAGAIMTYKRLG